MWFSHILDKILWSYLRVQKIASVNGVVQRNGTIMPGTQAREIIFSAVQILGWFELIVRAPRMLGWLVCLCCNVVIHLCIWGCDWTEAGDVFFVECVTDDVRAANLVRDVPFACPTIGCCNFPKHRVALWRISIWDNIIPLFICTYDFLKY